MSAAWKGVVLSGFALIAVCGTACTAAAGDLLRGGYTTSTQNTSASPNAFIPTSASQALKNAQDVLARTTKTIDSVNAMQTAARKIALSGGNSGLVNPSNPSQTLPVVPNGLATGGLVPTTGATANSSLWSGANLPTQTVSNGKTTVTIVQNSQDAVLNWNSFNVGTNTTLNFNQSKGGSNVDNWIAFNIVNNPNAVPTQILGEIQAPGQVYVIDHNGIVFGGASQVNLHTLVASSLQINTSLISSGLLNNPSSQYLFSALFTPPGANGTPNGNVYVEPGAELTAPSNAASVGGRIVLVGPEVDNEGTISTPDGQTILAAGLQVGFGASSDDSLRGLDAYVGAISNSHYPSSPDIGTAINGGIIYSPDGDTMITGASVEQNGIIGSTTSVTLNGRIDLLADYGAIANPGLATSTNPSALAPFLYQNTGVVTLGANSVTDILPELNSTDTVVGTQLALNSSIRIDGQAVHFSSGSVMMAPGADVSINAGFWGPIVNGKNQFQYYSTANSSPQVYFDAGSILDVAGSVNVDASVTQNIVSAQLLGAQLEDDPLQRNGPLRGQTVNIDIRQQGVYDGTAWIGTPLANLSGYAGDVQYSVGELTIGGGIVTIHSGGSVVLQKGSEVNVSGGYINYQGGMVDTTQLLAEGHIIDIANATPDIVYQGIYAGQFTVDYAKYGLSDTFTAPLLYGSHYEAGYVYGGNGGAIQITSPSMALDGQMLGFTASGPRQLQVTAAPSSFSLSFAAQLPEGSSVATYYPTPPTIYIRPDNTLTPVGPFALNASGDPEALPADRIDTVILSPDLTEQDGFGTFNIDDSEGKIIVPSGVQWNGPATTFMGANSVTEESSITLFSANTTIDGSITLPGGNLTFDAFDISLSQINEGTISQINATYNPDRGNFILGAGASLDTSGLLVDNRAASPTADTLPLVDAGGTVFIAASNTDLKGGSVVNVSGGAEIGSTGSIAYGKGGKITLAAGEDLSIASVLGGRLTLDGVLEGYSGAQGGSIKLTAPLVRIGGAAADADSLLLSPDFFDMGGFTSFSIKGLGETAPHGTTALAGLVIAPGTMIDPTSENAVLDPGLLAAGELSMDPTVLPEQSRSPVNLTFSAGGTSSNIPGNINGRGTLVVADGAVIESGPGGTTGAVISLAGDTVTVLGSVIAPGGAISVTGAPSYPESGGSPELLTTVELGPDSLLSASGIMVPTANAYGYTTGYVLNGGQVTLSGNIVAKAGSVINVSGAQAVLDMSPAFSEVTPSGVTSFAGASLVPTTVESNGGIISLIGQQELFSDATLQGAAGGSAALGGELIVTSGVFDPNAGGNIPPNQPTMDVTQNPVFFKTSGSVAAGQAVLGSNGKPLAGMGYFSVSSFEGSGLDFLNLEGSVEFTGRAPINLNANGSITIGQSNSIGVGGFIYADTGVHISAPYVELGLAFSGPLTSQDIQSQIGTGFGSGGSYYATLQSGQENFTVTADLIDIGNLVLQGVANAKFVADDGAIRGDGTLDTMGNILMEAAQIYPPTEDTFNIISYGGSVTFKAAGTAQLPLSAGGSLNVYASTIIQDGVLEAPMGEITLGWNGQGTSPLDPLTGAGYKKGVSVPVAQQITLGARSITSVSLIDPTTGQPVEIPYGLYENGNSWIDPSGNNITAGGLPQKSITISGNNVTDGKGAKIDIRGGGNLFAYEFVSGIGGDVDVLGSALSGNQVTSDSFAIIPGYDASYAPLGGYDTLAGNGNVYVTNSVVSDYGYTNSSLTGIGAGQQVYLNPSNGLAAGVYTLLPARYALMPGAYLVTLEPGVTPAGSELEPDGSALVSGYVMHSLDQGQTGQPLVQSFDVASQAVLANRADYSVAYANSFLASSAIQNSQPVPLLPKDGGHLIITAGQTLSLEGQVEAQVPADGKGGLVDISTNNPDGILITGAASSSGGSSGQLVLNTASLDALNVGSLLIGGVRGSSNGSTVDVTTQQIDVDDSSDPLTGADIILAATGNITLDAGAVIESTGGGNGGGSITVSGNGALVRVASDPNLTTTRTGVNSSTTASLDIGDNVQLTGGSVTLDSSQKTQIGSKVAINAQSIALDSGNITLNLDGNAPASGLVLSAQELQTLTAGAQSVSLLSYQSLNIYGSGQIGAAGKGGTPTLANLSIHAGAINGFDDGNVTFAAQNILLDNSADASVAAGAAGGGTLTFDGGTIELGAISFGSTAANLLNIGQFSNVVLNATDGVVVTNESGSQSSSSSSSGTQEPPTGGVSVNGNLTITAPVITAASGVTGNLASPGVLTLQSAKSGKPMTGGEGATLSFTAASINADSSVIAHSGNVSLTAQTGDVDLGSAASIDVSGVARPFFNVTEYLGGGKVTLTSDEGSVNIAAVSNKQDSVNVSANSGGGNAGTFTVSAANGTFSLMGQLAGNGGANGGIGGNFSLDVGTLDDVKPLVGALSAAGFNEDLAFRVRNSPLVTVDGDVTAASFQLEVDNGAIDVTGVVNAFQNTTDADGNVINIGGSISLIANGNITLESGAVLNASGQNYNNAGQGGSVSLITNDGLITISAGSTINLAVKDAPSGAGASQEVAGTLYIQAPQVDASGNVLAVNADPTSGVDVNVAPIAGQITGASSITVVGNYVQDADTTGVANIDTYDGNGNLLSTSLEAVALENAADFMNNASSTVAQRIIGGSGISASTFNLEPGEEITNSKGGLILNDDWDLSTARYGTQMAVVNTAGQQLYDNNGNPISVGNEPGVLTLRAAGNITFNGALSDGFGDGTGSLDEPFDNNGNPELWEETLLPDFSNGTAQRSWSYNIAAGADFTAAGAQQTLANAGAVQIGYVNDNGINSSSDGTVDGAIYPNQNQYNASGLVIQGYYQVVRTGAGAINVAAGGDVQLLNQFATIYTAGSLVPNQTLNGTFQVPILYASTTAKLNGDPLYPAQYSDMGGNVDITAGGDIIHLYQNASGQLVDDSEAETPNNWLFRRGDINSSTGNFAPTIFGDIASTTWWVDFSNFFEGVGALGGGNVSMHAGGAVMNVDAVVPTNGRMPTGTPNASDLVELGGGNLLVQSGGDISGGIYYVEHGQGDLIAGGQITTNATRSPSLSFFTDAPLDSQLDWLPTTLFLGDGSFNVTAAGNVLLGPVENPFLLPSGINNSILDKTFFSTFGENDAVNVTSAGGSVTLREEATTNFGQSVPILETWYYYQTFPSVLAGATVGDYFQPWLLGDENDLAGFQIPFELQPGTLNVAAFGGDIDIVGNLELSPAPRGGLNLLAAGSVNGLQPDGNGAWTRARIGISDASPGSIYGIASPLGAPGVVSATKAVFELLYQALSDSGATLGQNVVLQNQQALHASGILHLGDTNPVHIFATDGSISGVQLISPKESMIIASTDITDIAFYIQNVSSSDVSVVSAGRDIIGWDQSSPLEQDAIAPGNKLDVSNQSPLAGDIQISGPGALEVLAGRNLIAGTGPENSDGTGAGITSVGNVRNPYLPFGGATVDAAAGLGGAAVGLDTSTLDFTSFINTFLKSTAGAIYFADLAASDPSLGVSDMTDFEKLGSEPDGAQLQSIVALDLFYLVLRDAGRDHNLVGSPGYGNYTAGFAAISALLPSSGASEGNIDLTSREIKTTSGGDINILDPVGSLTVGIELPGGQAVDQGILTEDGGNISIYTEGDVNLGTSRIFTLRGGNIIMWSTAGNIAAGASSKTVQSAPPTRVLVDPQSGNVQTDLSGLATGGGIGVLASVAGVPPGSVDLIAPTGVIDAGDAGIRATGNLNLAATQILNASNIQAGGASTGVPVSTVAAPNIGAITTGNAAAGAGANNANQSANQVNNNQPDENDQPSVIDVQVLGYGGGEDG